MPAPDPSVRDRLLAAAERCFYRVGITGSGVDAIAAEAGVSKRTLYNQFGSKDQLVTAYLAMREDRWRTRLGRLMEQAGDDPVERVLAYLRGYATPPVGDAFRGCALINAAAELAGPEDPALALVQESIGSVEREVAQILVEAGVSDAEAERVAAQVLVVLEGAVAVGGVRRSRDEVLKVESLLRSLVQPVLEDAMSPTPA